jgi:thiol-disulfide isomerase/thioredoxin
MKSLSRSAVKKAKKFMNSKYAILILLLVVVGGYLLFNWYQNGKLELFSGEAKLYFFFADWCGYCKKFKPEWEKLKNESNLGVKLEEVDCSDSNNTPSLAKEYEVGGFPTLILVNGGNKVTYEGERTKDAIVSFIKDNH